MQSLCSAQTEFRYWSAVNLPWTSRHLSRVLRLGPPHDARHQCAQQDLSRSHLPDEWPGDGHQRHLVVPERTADRRAE